MMRILLISKLYPPSSSARALQMRKVVEALRRAGCKVHVIAGLEEGGGIDPATIAETSFVHYGKTIHLRRLHNLLRTCGWIFRTVLRAVRVSRMLKPDILFTASTPVDSHIVGLLMRPFVRRPWMAYFSDPWPPSICPAPYNIGYGPWRSAMQKLMVGRIIRKADGVVVTNTYALELMQAAFKTDFGLRGFVIPHIGSQVAKLPADRKRMISHIGDLLNRVTPALLGAIKRIADQCSNNSFGVLFAGAASDELKSFIVAQHLEQTVVCREWIPPADALEIISSSSVLLVIEADMEYSPFLPSKFADYSQTGIPILAISPPKSAIRDYLVAFGGGIAVRHDEAAIALAAMDLLCRVADVPRPSGLAVCFKEDVVAKQYLSAMHSLLVPETIT